VIIGVKQEVATRRHTLDQGFQQLGHTLLDRLGIGSTEERLELRAALLLAGGHRTLTPQRAVGEMIEEPRVRAGGEVDVEGEILGELKRLEAVDDQGFDQWQISEEITMEDQTMPTDTGEVPCRGGVADAEDASHLAQAWALTGPGGHASKDVSVAQPVGGREGAGGEVTSAVEALEGLESLLI